VQSTKKYEILSRVLWNLGYLDFTLVNTVPQRFRDGIVCAFVQVVFARNMNAFFGRSMGRLGDCWRKLLADPLQPSLLLEAFSRTLDAVLVYQALDQMHCVAIIRPEGYTIASSLIHYPRGSTTEEILILVR
jgi:hypothetical protein